MQEVCLGLLIVWFSMSAMRSSELRPEPKRTSPLPEREMTRCIPSVAVDSTCQGALSRRPLQRARPCLKQLFADLLVDRQQPPVDLQDVVLVALSLALGVVVEYRG